LQRQERTISAGEYATVNDLPFVYRYNLPAPALEIFRRVYNETCRRCGLRPDGDLLARQTAIAAVKQSFAKDPFGTWRPKN
jgi:cation transport regulator ChaB